MKFTFIVTLLAVFASHQSHAYSEKWFSCSSDDECVKVNSTCGRLSSVNVKFKKEYNKHIQKAQQVSSCRELQKEDLAAHKEATIQCLSGKCDLKAKITILEKSVPDTVYELTCTHIETNPVVGSIANRVDDNPTWQQVSKKVDLHELGLDIDKQIKLNCSKLGKDYRNPLMNVQKIFVDGCKPAKDLAPACMQLFYARIDAYKDFEKGATQGAKVFSKSK